MITIFFCQVCQDSFRARKGQGGRTLCLSCSTKMPEGVNVSKWAREQRRALIQRIAEE